MPSVHTLRHYKFIIVRNSIQKVAMLRIRQTYVVLAFTTHKLCLISSNCIELSILGLHHLKRNLSTFVEVAHEVCPGKG